MLKRVVRFIARRVIPEDFSRPAILRVTKPKAEPLNFDPGLLDSKLSGWFNFETGDLLTGFPISQDDVVLDVGCGDGGNTFFCGHFAAKIIFADIDAERLAKMYASTH